MIGKGLARPEPATLVQGRCGIVAGFKGLGGCLFGLNSHRQKSFFSLDQFKADPLALFEGFETLHLDGRKMGEGVSSSAIGLYEAKTLGIVEPFDRAMGHTLSPCLLR